MVVFSCIVVIITNANSSHLFVVFLQVRLLTEVYKECEEDNGANLLVMTGAGNRAFCAGGDVAAVCIDGVRRSKEHSSSSSTPPLSRSFFFEEYQLNYMVATFAKVQVSLWDGIVMGGGIGVSLHGHYRVATENTLFSIPEGNCVVLWICPNFLLLSLFMLRLMQQPSDFVQTLAPVISLRVWVALDDTSP